MACPSEASGTQPSGLPPSVSIPPWPPAPPVPVAPPPPLALVDVVAAPPAPPDPPVVDDVLVVVAPVPDVVLEGALEDGDVVSPPQACERESSAAIPSISGSN